MRQFDAVVIGAGLAGLQYTRQLAEEGFRVLLVERKGALDVAHTTGIFVRKTLEDFDIPQYCLGTAVKNVKLYSPKHAVLELSSPHDEFRVGKMVQLYQKLMRECLDAGAEVALGTRYVSSDPSPYLDNWSVVNLEIGSRRWQVETDLLVGADGVCSQVAKDLGLQQNKHWIIGVEDVYTGIKPSEPCFHCFLDPELAPGYLAWVVNDGEEVHVGVGGYLEKFNPQEALERFQDKIHDAIDLSQATKLERRGGRIPVGGVLKHISNARGLLLGDAAGAVSPLTAGGLDPCLRLSEWAVRISRYYLHTGETSILRNYSGKPFRSRFLSRLWMRNIMANMQHPFVLEFAHQMLRQPVMKHIAWQIFFGRGGSFPEIDLRPKLANQFNRKMNLV